MNKDIAIISYIIGYIFTAINLVLINGIPKDVGGAGGLGASTGKSGKQASMFCGMGIPFSGLSAHASPTTAIISYTLFYLLMPSFLKNIDTVTNPISLLEKITTDNLFMLVGFIILMSANMVSEKMYGCDVNAVDEYLYHAYAAIIGLFSAWLYLLIVYISGKKDMMLKTHFLSNSTMCAVSTRKMFRCKKNMSAPNSIILSFTNNFTTEHGIYETLSYGHPDLENIKTLKIFEDYKFIHVGGDTTLIFYQHKKFKGDKFILSSNVLTGAIANDASRGGVDAGTGQDEMRYISKGMIMQMSGLKQIDSIRIVKE